MTEKLRQYKQDEADVLNTRAAVGLALATGIIPERKTLTIAELKISKFCGGCDNFETEGIPCKLVGANNQARYAARAWCGWAYVEGKKVIKSGSDGKVQSP